MGKSTPWPRTALSEPTTISPLGLWNPGVSPIINRGVLAGVHRTRLAELPTTFELAAGVGGRFGAGERAGLETEVGSLAPEIDLIHLVRQVAENVPMSPSDLGPTALSLF